MWTSMLKNRDQLARGCHCVVDKGQNTNIRESPWILENQATKARCERDSKLLKGVAGLMKTGGREWDTSQVQQSFNEEICTRILSIPTEDTCHRDGDRLIWKFTGDGEFSTRSAYKLLALDEDKPTASNQDPIRKLIWDKELTGIGPPKVSLFLWRSISGWSLPTSARTEKHCPVTEDLCPMCGLQPETVEHLLGYCQFAQATWMTSQFWMRSE